MELQNNVEYLNRMIGQMGTAACAYPFFQRYIVAGLTIGSVKG